MLFAVDDARLLLGVYYHGFGNWEKIRTDTRLCLMEKIAPAGTAAAETSLPRATHLDARASALLRKVVCQFVVFSCSILSLCIASLCRG